MGARALAAIKRRGCSQFKREQDGQAILEMAFVLPVAVLFTFGILQYCLFLTCYISGTYASRAAVRYAVVHGSASTNPCTATTLRTQVQPFLFGIPQSDIVFTPTWNPDNDAGSTITVRVSFTYPTAIPFQGSVTLTSVSTASGIILQ